MIKINNETIWQVGSGDGTRDYSNVCLEFGIAIVGPGRPGDARLPKTREHYQITKQMDWGAYLKDLKLNDIVLLRRGQSIIKAIGKVVEEYNWSPILSDVEGWDLNHYVKVEWYVTKNSEDIEIPKSSIGYSTLPTVQTNYENIKKLINDLELTKLNSIKKIEDLKISSEINTEEIKLLLIDLGLRVPDAENVSDTINRIKILTEWYLRNDPDVGEHEIRTFLVVPFLLSLGWSEQKIKYEYLKVDLALFQYPFRRNENKSPKILIETKTFNDGLAYAESQIKNYASNFPEVNILISTNGFRYIIYERENGKFVKAGYLNLLDMRMENPLSPNIKGPFYTISKMAAF